MTDKLLSVEEAKDAVFIEMQSHGIFLGTETRAIFTSQKLAKLDALVYAVRHEERERAVKIIDSTLKIPFENYLDVQAVKKKILEAR